MGGQSPHPYPTEPVLLAAATQRLEPVPSQLSTKGFDGVAVDRHGVVVQVSPNHASEPLALDVDGLVPALL